MRNNYDNQNESTVSTGDLANDARNVSKLINDDRRKIFFETIDDFYQQAGVEGPVETIGDLLQHFFTANDEVGLDDAKPTPVYRMYDGTHYVADIVLSTMNTIKFLVKLNSVWASFPENPDNSPSI